jgi:site-specific recombinase XerD
MKGLVVTVEGGAMVDVQDKMARAFEDWVKFCDVSTLTQRAYNSAAKKFFTFISDNGTGFNSDSLVAFREYCKKTFSTSSARLYFQIARKFCQWTCQKMNVSDFTAGLKGVKVENEVHSRDALPLEDCAKVISNISGNDFVSVRNRTIITLMIDCGLRRVEIHRLDVGDVELRRGKYFLRVFGKARSGKNDFVPLPKTAKKVLDEYLKLRGKAGEKEPLFISNSNNSKGKRISCQSISKLTKSALVNAGFNSKRLTTHSLRHSFASAAINEGVGIRNVQLVMRHKTAGTTEIYLHDEKQFCNNACDVVGDKLDYYLKGGK